MINARKILPVDFWNSEGTEQADHLVLYNFHDYNFDDTDSKVSYKLGYIEINGLEEKWVSLHENTITLPYELVQEWGENDEPIFDYAIQELNLTRDIN